MAEAVLKYQIAKRPSLKAKFDITVDSAGTGAYHEGDDADERTIATCRKHKIPISCTARKVTQSDFSQFDYILAMDTSNLQTLLQRAPPSRQAHISLFGAFDPSILHPPSGSKAAKPQGIADPYYGGSSGFERCYEACVRYSEGFLDWLEETGGR